MKKRTAGLIGGTSLAALLAALFVPLGQGGYYNNIWDFFQGNPSTYGCDPKGSYNDCYGDDDIEFNPKIYSVIYMRFGNLRSGKRQGFISRHAYFKYIDGRSNLECAIKYLRKPSSVDDQCPAIKPNPNTIDNHILAAHRNLYKPAYDTSRRPFQRFRNDFDGVLHGSQQKVFVVIDNHQIKFNSITPMSFTPFGAYDFTVGQKFTRASNSSMFNAKISELEITTETETGTETKKLDILSYENYYLDENGVQIDKKKKQNTTFSINYNLLICVLRRNACNNIDAGTTQTGKTIPIAIDPDTGNGWGSNP